MKKIICMVMLVMAMAAFVGCATEEKVVGDPINNSIEQTVVEEYEFSEKGHYCTEEMRDIVFSHKYIEQRMEEVFGADCVFEIIDDYVELKCVGETVIEEHVGQYIKIYPKHKEHISYFPAKCLICDCGVLVFSVQDANRE